MSTLAAIRAGVAAGIDGFAFADGRVLRCPDYVTDQLNTPQAVFDFEIGAPISMGNARRDVTLIVGLYDQRDSERGSQVRLDEARDHSSDLGLPDIIEALVVSGVDYFQFLEATRVLSVTIGPLEYLTCELRFGCVF